MSEASIVINGVVLSHAQAMTVRVALGSFSIDLHNDGLGDDDHGIAMTEAYLSRIVEINSIIHPTMHNDSVPWNRRDYL